MAGITVEQKLETSFVKWCKEHKIVAMKGPVGLSKGFPDRFAMLPDGGGTVYVEFKGTSYYGLTEIQRWWQKYLLNSSPHRYFLVENDEQLENLKQKCLDFIAIGQILTDYETLALEERAIMRTKQEETK